MILLKCYTQYVSKFGKLSRGHTTGKGQFSFQPQRWTMPKNAQSAIPHLWLTRCGSMNCNLLGSSVGGIFQARIPEWVAISFCRGSSQPRDWTQDSSIAGRLFAIWATREALFLSSRGQTEWKPQSQKTNQSDHMDTALYNSMKLWAMRVGPPKMDGSWWRILTKCGPLEKGMANHFTIFALRTPWTLWKGTERQGTERWTPQVGRCPICYWRSVEK